MNPATAQMHGAVTVINATATGQGASLAVNGGVRATWEWIDGSFQFQNPDVDDRLARAVHAQLQATVGPRGAIVRTSSQVAAERGLKTSSGAAAAMLKAGSEAAGLETTDDELIQASVQACRQAGVTLTGAFDDQVAVVRGGCALTDNAAQTIAATITVKPWTVAIWVPTDSIPKSAVQFIDAQPLRGEVQAAIDALLDGDLPGAMTRNGAAFTQLYAQAGLPVSAEPARVALDAGALGAGLSGTGPAVAALFPPGTEPELPEVAGGRWMFTEAVA